MTPTPAVEFDLADSILDIGPACWDALGEGHPALSHAFLAALERSGSVGGDSGWWPRYLLGYRRGTLVAAVPLFLKAHSYGEYVFDWAWADAYQRHGVQYYPKWLVASPFSPLPGMRLLGRDPELRRAGLRALLQVAASSELSSLHVLFPTREERDWMQGAGMLLRKGVQFHWIGRGESDFDGFLTRLNHEKRKKIRQDRKRVERYGLRYNWLDGASASDEDWAFFMHCYEDTYRAHRSTPYLNAEFFRNLARSMPDAISLLIARRSDRPVASAFFLRGANALYGRYWGCSEALPGLHFEMCYYRPIIHCLEQGLHRMEGGAQGEHKLSRGLEPVETWSAHWVADARFRDAIDRHLDAECQHMSEYVDELQQRSPFRRAGDGPPRTEDSRG